MKQMFKNTKMKWRYTVKFMDFVKWTFLLILTVAAMMTMIVTILSKKTVYILTDYIDAETLEIKLSEARDPFEIFTLLFNVVTAVKKFNLEWIHGDLHAENILIDAKGNVFLIDFESTYKPNKIVYGDIKWIIKIFDETLSSYNKNIGLQIEIKDLIKFIEQSLKNEAHSLESFLFTIVLDDLAFLKKFSCEIFNMACRLIVMEQCFLK